MTIAVDVAGMIFRRGRRLLGRDGLAEPQPDDVTQGLVSQRRQPRLRPGGPQTLDNARLRVKQGAVPVEHAQAEAVSRLHAFTPQIFNGPTRSAAAPNPRRAARVSQTAPPCRVAGTAAMRRGETGVSSPVRA